MTTLQEEIRQTRPFVSLEHEAAVAIARTAAVFEHEVAEALRPHGVTPTQYNALRILRGAGPEGLCRNDVGARLVAMVPDATRLLDRLEDMGLVTRQRSSVDRRLVLTRITDAGLQLLAALDEPMQQLHLRRLGHLGPDRLRALIQTLEEARQRR